MSASDLNDVLKITMKMKKMIKNKSVVPHELLRYFNFLKETNMTLEILTKTGVGLVLNQLRRLTDDAEVDKAGKALIKSWRSLVPSSTASTNQDDSTTPNLSTQSSQDDRSLSSSQTEIKNQIKSQKSSSSSNSTTSPPNVNKDRYNNNNHINKSSSLKRGDFSSTSSSSTNYLSSSLSGGGGGGGNNNPLMFRKNHETNDPTRLKSRELLQKALEVDSEIPEGAFDVEFLAVEIEVALYREFKDVDTKYKNRLRSRIMNLRDKANSQLRHNVLMGHISADRFAKMTADEMASDEMKKMRDQFTQEAINEHQLSVQGGTETDLIKCRKCGKNRCTYTQLQTRSSDEPMTTFVYCTSCGHRFKFC